jgi:hypothetical protein
MVRWTSLSWRPSNRDPKTIHDDALVEGNETIELRLSDPLGRMVNRPENSAQLIIVDDDNDAGVGKGLNGTIYASLVEPNNRVIVAGEFTSVDGTNRNYVARLNRQTTLDETFGRPGGGPNGPVYFLAAAKGTTMISVSLRDGMAVS